MFKQASEHVVYKDEADIDTYSNGAFTDVYTAIGSKEITTIDAALEKYEEIIAEKKASL